MTLNGVMTITLRYTTEFNSFGTNYVKWLKIDPNCLRRKPSSVNLVVLEELYDLWRYAQRFLRTNSVEMGTPVTAVPNSEIS